MQETLEQLLARLKAEIHDAEHGDVDREELAKFGSSLPGGGTRSSDERVLMTSSVLASAVAVILLDSGATAPSRR